MYQDFWVLVGQSGLKDLRDRVRNIGRRALVTAGLFCYSPRLFEILRWARESERLAA